MNFADRLLNLIDEKQNPSVVGLDPRIDMIPQFIKDESIDRYGDTIKAVAQSFIIFNKKIIDAAYDIVPVVKPQVAFYEKYGDEGMRVFHETIKYAHTKGLIVIADAKRNDIGSTAIAYSNGYLGEVELCSGKSASMFDLDALTVNPYLGSDCIRPFIEDAKKYGKGCFILVKTSNPSSIEIQDRKIEGGKTIFELIGQYVNEWGSETVGERGYCSIGAVIGATFPAQAKKLRELMKKSIFLSPGYGAQGAKGKDVIPLFNKDGYGAIISSSREIIFAYKQLKKYSEDNFYEASRQAAVYMKEDINLMLKDAGIFPW